MNFRHLDYFKKTGQGSSQCKPSPVGEGGARAGLAKPNCVPFEEPLMPFDCVGLLKKR